MHIKRIVLIACIFSIVCGWSAIAEETAEAEPPADQPVSDEQDADEQDADEPGADEPEAVDASQIGEFQQFNQLYVDAENNLKDGRIGQAYAAFKLLAEQVETPALAEHAAARTNQIMTNGRIAIEAAVELDDIAETYRRISSLYGEYWHTPLRSEMKNVRKQLLIRSARMSVSGGQAGPAANEGREAHSWLIIGGIHQLNGRPKEAEEAYKTLIYDYPESRFAEEARMRLDDIRLDAAAAKGDE